MDNESNEAIYFGFWDKKKDENLEELKLDIKQEDFYSVVEKNIVEHGEIIAGITKDPNLGCYLMLCKTLAAVKRLIRGYQTINVWYLRKKK